MYIPNEAYIVFYEALRAKLELLIPKSKTGQSENRKLKIWERVNPDGKKNSKGLQETYFETHFHKYAKINNKHFYNRYLASKSGVRKKAKGLPLTKYEVRQYEKDVFLCDLLKDFLRIDYPFKIKESELTNNALRAAILFQIFIEINEPSLLDTFSSLRVYDRQTGTIISGIGNSNPESNKVILYSKLEQVHNHIDQIRLQGFSVYYPAPGRIVNSRQNREAQRSNENSYDLSRRSAEQFISDYFQMLSKADYIDALNSWGYKQQEVRWKNQALSFYLEYGEILKVDDIILFDINFIVKNNETVICQCKTLYDETSFALGHQSFFTFLGGWQEMGAFLREKVTRKAKEMKRDARSNSDKNLFDRRKVFNEILEQENKEYIIGELHEQPIEILDTISRKRLEQIELKWELNQWKITNIASINTQIRV